MSAQQVVRMLKVLYALVSLLCNIMALVIARFYPIDSRTHEKIRLAVDAGKSGL